MFLKSTKLSMNPDDKAYNELLQNINDIISGDEKLIKQAFDAYEPTINNIIKTKCVDVNKIEHTLGGLNGFCYDEKILLLYKKLCRYYWDIDPYATAFYINLYREMWDNENEIKP